MTSDYISLSGAAIELGISYFKLYAFAGPFGAKRIDGHLYFHREALPAIKQALRERAERDRERNVA